jgi:trk system potassium uptake protein TrkA
VKIVIVGCGRVGAASAELWHKAGHEVIVLDISTRAFERLPSSFGGTAIRGDGTDEDVLRRAGAEGADILLALTEGDNRNIMSAQLGVEALEIPKVVAKINDPLRAAAYAELGIATVCRTGLIVDAMNGYLGMPPSGLSGMLQPIGDHAIGDHPGGRHGRGRGQADAPVVADAPAVAAAPGPVVEA